MRLRFILLGLKGLALVMGLLLSLASHADSTALDIALPFQKYIQSLQQKIAGEKHTLIPLAEAGHTYAFATVNGIEFAVPLNYFFRGYNQENGGWVDYHPEVAAIDFLTIEALLPDLEPVTKSNLADFEALGFGKVVTASLTHFRPWDYYFKNSFQYAKRLPDSPQVPGMLHYYDMLGDIYLSYPYASKELTVIRCPEFTCADIKIIHGVSPYCEVETFYYPPSELVATEPDKKTIFRLEYTFSIKYISQWRDIDSKLKSLYDQFIRNAQRQPAAH